MKAQMQYEEFTMNEKWFIYMRERLRVLKNNQKSQENAKIIEICWFDKLERFMIDVKEQG